MKFTHKTKTRRKVDLIQKSISLFNGSVTVVRSTVWAMPLNLGEGGAFVTWIA